MFEKVLIANRGEIALRVARACRELGVKSVAIYSTVDEPSAVVKFADEAQDVADSIGYPVIIKAVAGGGGRRVNGCWKKEDLVRLYQTTRATAQAVFKNSAVYIERYLPAPRHTEVQVVCDANGEGCYFGERDCSVQRRHQKLIEEAPSIHLTPEMRADVG